MIRHQQFQQRAPHIANLVGVGGDRHAFFGGPHTGCAQHASAGFDHATRQTPTGVFVLLMAQRGDRDAVHARGIEDGRARWYGNCLTVDR